MTRVCDSERSIFWIAVLFLTKFFVQAAAVFFAFKTRKVKIKVLNDAKIISIIIYVSTALLTIMFISAIALGNYLNADAGVFGTGLVVVTVVVLILLFIPKVNIKLLYLHHIQPFHVSSLSLTLHFSLSLSTLTPPSFSLPICPSLSLSLSPLLFLSPYFPFLSPLPFLPLSFSLSIVA